MLKADAIRAALKREGLPEAHYRPTTRRGWWQGRWTRGLRVFESFVEFAGRWPRARREAALNALDKHFRVTPDDTGYRLGTKDVESLAAFHKGEES